MKNPVSNEPVLVQAVATIVVWLAARYGFQLDAGQATAIAGVLFAALAPYVRSLVRPTVKDQAPLTPAELASARALLGAAVQPGGTGNAGAPVTFSATPPPVGGYGSGDTPADQLTPPAR